MLRKIAPNLWVFDSTFCVYCFKGSTRMTIIRLKNGKLWVNSPLCIPDSVKKEIQGIGDVAYVVAPNNMHYLYFKSFLDLFPQAQGYVAQSLVDKKRYFEIYHPVHELKDLIGQEIEQLEFEGHTLGEVVFFHKSSKTLILTDLLYNLQPHNLWFEKWVMWLFGAYGKPAIPIYHKVAIKNKGIIIKCVDRITKWPIKRVIMAHGDILTGADVGQVFYECWNKICGLSTNNTKR